MGSHDELQSAKYLNQQMREEFDMNSSDVSPVPLSTDTYLEDFQSEPTPRPKDDDSSPRPNPKGRSFSLAKAMIVLLGIAITGFGVAGVARGIWGPKVQPVRGEDITTEGTVTDITVTEMKHKLGVTLSRT